MPRREVVEEDFLSAFGARSSSVFMLFRMISYVSYIELLQESYPTSMLLSKKRWSAGVAVLVYL